MNKNLFCFLSSNSQYFFIQAYLEDFYEYCKKLGGITGEVMCDIIAVCNTEYKDMLKKTIYLCFSLKPIVEHS